MVLTEICHDLIGHLHAELEHLEGLREVLNRERESLIHNDLEGVMECIKEKETFQMQGRMLDESRRLVRKRLVDALSVDDGENPVRLLIDRIEEPMRSRVNSVRERLEEVFQQVETLTQGNQYLIRAALGQLSKSIGFLRQFQGGMSSTYDGKGHMSREGSLISKVEQQA